MVDFTTHLLRQTRQQLQQANLALHFKEDEQRVLRLFYDARLKVWHKKIAKFYFYARLCEGLDDSEWAREMSKCDLAIHNLVSIGYLQKVPLSPLGQLVGTSVGGASDAYELTASGLEVLQSWHPNLGIRLKAWIAVAPPWIVLAGSVLGGIGALWKIAEFVLELSGAAP